MPTLNNVFVHYRFVGTYTKLLVSGEQTSGAFSMLEMLGPPGVATPMHVHAHEEETIHVLEGALEATIGDKTMILQAGETIVLPRQMAHRLSTHGERTARYFVVCSPAGFERFIDACADAQDHPVTPEPPSPADIERLCAVATRYGISLLDD